MKERTLVEELEARVKARRLPRHVAIIMDGNGRWAEGRGLPRVAGHREGAESVRAVVRTARRVGLECLTLYALSLQNLGRPKDEVDALMGLLARFLEEERQEMLDNGIRLVAVGELERLPGAVRERLQRVMAATAGCRDMTLALALSYGGREELVRAARLAAVEKGAAIEAEDLERHLWTHGLPELDLLVRTSGEVRISNFLLWQCAYAEMVFTDVLWPDFREVELLAALDEYAGRERRFGLTAAQVADGARDG